MAKREAAVARRPGKTTGKERRQKSLQALFDLREKIAEVDEAIRCLMGDVAMEDLNQKQIDTFCEETSDKFDDSQIGRHEYRKYCFHAIK